MQHVFLVGAKSFGAFGGFETFIDKLTEYHEGNENIRYHVAVKANGQGAQVPSGAVRCPGGYRYHNAECFEIRIPEFLGNAQAVYYDCVALKKCISAIRENKIEHPLIYVMTCRIGPFFKRYVRAIHKLGGKVYLNPDGHEWKRAKWSRPVRAYWRYSERKMVLQSDRIICDSKKIEQYIRETYPEKETAFIAYGAETAPSRCEEERFDRWLDEKGLQRDGYYLIVGRLVPENNYETMIREFMSSSTEKTLAIISNRNDSLYKKLETKLHFSQDQRIRFLGPLYDWDLLKKVREEAFCYLHGHETGGTNPSLLEALGSTKLNLLLKVGFNEEVAQDAALYWTKEEGNLAGLLKESESLDLETRENMGEKAKARIREAYTWERISSQYNQLFTE